MCARHTDHCAASPAECGRRARPWHRVPVARSAARPRPSAWGGVSGRSASSGISSWAPPRYHSPQWPGASVDGAAPWWVAYQWHSPNAGAALPRAAATPPTMMAATFQRRLLEWIIYCHTGFRKGSRKHCAFGLEISTMDMNNIERFASICRAVNVLAIYCLKGQKVSQIKSSCLAVNKLLDLR